MKKHKKTYIKMVLILVGIGLCSYLFLSVIFRYDNKYNHIQAPVKNGVLTLQDDMFTHNQRYSLVDNWEYYNHQYVTPSTIHKANLSGYMYAGQYPDYSMRKKDVSAFGISSYRLHMKNIGKPKTITLFIPEVDTAYEVWIDKTKVMKNGDIQISKSTPYIKNRTISLTVEKDMDLLIVVGNSQFYYSGLYYPPVISSSEGIMTMIQDNILFYAFLCFSTMAISLYSFHLWMQNRKDKLYKVFGIATISFALYSSSSLWNYIGYSNVSLMYGIFDCCYFIMLYALLRMNAILSHQEITKVYRYIVSPCSIGVAFISLFYGVIVPVESSVLLNIYGTGIDLYKYVVGVYILYTSFIGLKENTKISMLIVSANFCYVIGILYTLYFANLFEPLRFGWPHEYFAFFVVVVFAKVMVNRNALIIKENEQMNLHLEELIDQRTKQLQTLLKERKALLNEIAHDMKAPVSSIQSFIEMIQDGNVHIDNEVQSYLSIIAKKSDELGNRMKSLQRYSHMDSVVEQCELIDVCSLMQEFYENNKPDCDAAGIYLHMKITIHQTYIYADRELIVRAFENILYNALAFTPVNGSIQIRIKTVNHKVIISFQDSGCGIPYEQQKHIFDKGISFRTMENEEHGLGLYITKTILIQHQGRIVVESDGKQGTCFIITLPIAG